MSASIDQAFIKHYQSEVQVAYQFFTEFVRPAVDETCGRLARSVGGEVGFVMVRTSPRISWIRGA